MEFSFHLHLPTSSWDETTRTLREEYPKACLFCAQIEADLQDGRGDQQGRRGSDLRGGRLRFRRRRRRGA